MADRAENSPELVDQLCRTDNGDLANDPELKKTQEDTVNIFIQYCSQTIVESKTTNHPTMSSNSTSKSKCRETHPKAVHSIKRTNDAAANHSAQIRQVPCAGAPLATSTPASVAKSLDKDYVIISQAMQADVQILRNDTNTVSCKSRNCDVNTTSDNGSRPRTLFLGVKQNSYKRGLSNSSSGKTTPAQDPPLLSPASELVQSYPPTGQWIHSSGNNGAAAANCSVVEVSPRHHIARLNVSI